MDKYISNRQRNLKIGISSYTENSTVLEVTGNVGIGTTQVPFGVRLAAGGMQVTDSKITSPNLDITGIATINKLGVNQLSPDGFTFGSASYIPIANGTGSWGWGVVTSAGAGTLSAIVIKDEGTTKGSVTELNFVGAAITASASGSVGTITLDIANLTGDVTSVGNVTTIATGVIVNADVNVAAAIAGTKISPDFGSQNITTTGAGSIQGLTVGRGAGAIASNTAIGSGALAANTTGATNVAVGFEALKANLGGSTSVAIGYQAMVATTATDSNVAIGYRALYSNFTGYGNIALGHSALLNSTTNNLVAIGFEALKTNTTGNNNVAVGFQALRVNSIGGSNTAIGFGALSLNTGNENSAFGEQSLGSVTTGTRNVGSGRRGLSDLTTGSDNTSLGNNSGNGITTGTGNTIIGSATGLAAGLTNNIILAYGTGTIKARYNGTSWAITDSVSVTSGIAIGGATAGAGGIAFPATAVAVTDANTLDDYEEGTWTPAITFGGAAVGLQGFFTGNYIKIGNLVTVTFRLVFTNKGSSTGAMAISGLPFSVDDGSVGISGFGYLHRIAAAQTAGQIFFQPSSTSLFPMFVGYAGANATGLVNTDFTNTTDIRGGIIYYKL